jgi:hypothetical protein
MGLLSFPPSYLGGLAGFRAKQPRRRASRLAVWRQYPHPDATVGVLTVPLKGYGYSSRRKCTPCSLMDSHSVSDVSRL